MAKLEDEAIRNGTVNWGDGHIRLLGFVRETLPPKGWGAPGRRKQVLAGLQLIGDSEQPVTDQAVSDRLHDAVGDWCEAHPEPIQGVSDPDLSI